MSKPSRKQHARKHKMACLRRVDGGATKSETIRNLGRAAWATWVGKKVGTGKGSIERKKEERGKGCRGVEKQSGK